MIGERRCVKDEDGKESRQTRFCNNTEPCTGKYFLKRKKISFKANNFVWDFFGFINDLFSITEPLLFLYILLLLCYEGMLLERFCSNFGSKGIGNLAVFLLKTPNSIYF